MKVAMIIQAYLPRFGGAEKLVAAILPYLRERGVEPVILTRRYPGLSSFEIIDGTPIYRLPIPGPKAIASLVFTLAGVFRLGKIQPDLIHAHELLSPTTTAVAAKRLYHYPVVVTLHRGGKLGDIDKLNHRFGGKARLRVFKKYVDGIFTISKQIDDELEETGFSVHVRHLVPPCLDMQRFSPVSIEEKRALRQRLSIHTNGPVVLFSGRLAEEKRVDILVRIWNEIQPEIGNAQLWILGSGPLEKDIKQLAGENIFFTGYVDDIPSYLRAADIFVLPSYTEGLSLAMLEAMASGLACVLTRVGGASDVIENGKNGILVDPNSVQELQEALLSVITNPTLCSELGDQARIRVKDDFSIEKVADQWVALYRSVCKE